MNYYLMIIYWIIFTCVCHCMDCFGDRLPFQIGCPQKDTELTSIAFGESSLYFGGWSQCVNYLANSTVQTQGALVGKSDSSGKLQWLNTFNNTSLVTVTDIALLNNLFVLVDFSNTFYIYIINKATGVNILWKKLGGFNTPKLLAPRSADVYLMVSQGFLRFKDIEGDDDAIQWYAKFDCSNFSECTSTALAESSDQYLYFATIIQNSTITSAQIHHFDKSGTKLWTSQLILGETSLSAYYYVKNVFDQGSKLIIMMEYSNTAMNKDLLVSVLNGISNSNHLQVPTSQQNFKVGFSDTKGLTLTNTWVDSNFVFCLLLDNTNKISYLAKIDLANLQYYFTQLSLSSGSDYRIIDSFVYGSSTQFYYGGYTKGFTDGTKTESFAKKIGFIMISDTSDTTTNCLSLSQEWSSGTPMTNENTISWIYDAQVTSNTLETSHKCSESEYQTSVMLGVSLYQSTRQWCWAANKFVLSNTDLGVTLNNFGYQSLSNEIQQQYNGITVSGDDGCDAYDLTIGVVSERTQSDGTKKVWVDAMPKAKSNPTLGNYLSFYSNSNAYEGTLTSFLDATGPNNFVFTDFKSANFTTIIQNGCIFNQLSAPDPSSFNVSSFTVNQGRTQIEFKSAGRVDGCSASYDVYIKSYTGVCNSEKHFFLSCQGSGGMVSTQFNNIDNSTVLYRQALNSIFIFVSFTDNDFEGVYTFEITATNEWTSANGVNNIIYSSNLTIYPDCSRETISAPASGSKNISYTMNDDALVYSFEGFSVSRASCGISYYTLLVSGLDPTQSNKALWEDRYITSLSGTSITVYGSSNLHGGKEIEMKLTARNARGITHTETFYLLTKKNCNFATLEFSSSFNLTMEYQIDVSVSGGTTLSLANLVSTNDSNCPFSHSVTMNSDNSALVSWIQNSGDTNLVVNTDLNSNDYSSHPLELRIYANNDNTVLNNLNISSKIQLWVYPDCSQESVSSPSVYSSSVDYTIYDEKKNVNINEFPVSRTYCKIIAYTTVVSPSTGNNFITFNSDLRQFQVFSEDNQYGDSTFTVTLSAQNARGISSTFSFEVVTSKNCGNVTLTPMAFDHSKYDYAVTQSALIISFDKFPQEATSYASVYCETLYEIFYQLRGGSSWSSGGFIVAFDTTSSNTKNHATIFTNDNNWYANYTMKAVAKVNPAQKGVNQYQVTTDLELESLCILLSFTTPLNGTLLDYFVWQPQRIETFSPFVPVWSDSTYSSSDLLSLCGSISYQMFVFTGNIQTQSGYDSSIFTQSGLTLTIKTDDPTKAGDITGVFKKRYALVLEGQIGPHYKNRGYFQFDVDIKDYCWVSKIMENPQTTMNETILHGSKTQIEVKQLLVQPLTPYIDSISKNILIPNSITSYYLYNSSFDLTKNISWVSASSFYSESFPSGYNCGSLTYEPYQTLPSFQVLDTNIIRFHQQNLTFCTYAISNNDRQNYTIEMKVSFSKYPSYPQLVIQQKIQVEKCQVQMLLMPSINDLIYNIKGGRKVHNLQNSIFYFFPECNYTMSFESYLNGQIPLKLPDFIKFDPTQESGDWYEIEIQDTELEGNSYELVLQVNIYDQQEHNSIEHYHYNVTNSRYIHWQLNLTYFPYIPPNIAPTYQSVIRKNFYLFKGESIQYSTGIPSNDTISLQISWTPKKLEKLMTYQINDETLETSFDFFPTDDEHIGTYKVSLILKDDDPPTPKESLYSFYVVVQQIPIVEQIQPEIVQKVDQGIIRPVMSYHKIQINGQVLFKFDEIMHIPQGYQNIGYEQMQQIITLSVIPGEDQDQSKTGITSYKFVSFESQEMTLQVVFENPIYISMGKTSDYLSVQVRNTTYFKSQETSRELDIFSSKYKIKIIPQMEDSDSTASFMGTIGSFNNGMNGFLLGNFILNVALSGSLNSLWTMINTLQLTLHLPAMNLKIPGNASFFSGILINIAKFDIIPQEYIKYLYVWRNFDGTYITNSRRLQQVEQTLTNDLEKEEINGQLQFCGYDSFNTVEMLGTFYIFLLLKLTQILILNLLKIFERFFYYTYGVQFPRFNNYYSSVMQEFFWNEALRLILETYLELPIVALIVMKNLDLSNFNQSVDESFSQASIIFLVIVYFGAPILVTIYLYDNSKKIRHEIYWKNILINKREKIEIDQIFQEHTHYGELFQQVDVNKNSGLYYNVIFMLRRMIFGYVIVQWENASLFQILVAMIMNFFYVLYIQHYKPLRTKFQNRIEVINESINMLVTYNFFTFTDYVTNLEARFLIGWFFICQIMFLILVNVYVMVTEKISESQHQYAKRKTQKRYEKQFKHIQRLFLEQQAERKSFLERHQPQPSVEESVDLQLHTRNRASHNRLQHLIDLKPIMGGRRRLISLEPNMTVVQEEPSVKSSLDEKLEKIGIRDPNYQRVTWNRPPELEVSSEEEIEEQPIEISVLDEEDQQDQQDQQEEVQNEEIEIESHEQIIQPKKLINLKVPQINKRPKTKQTKWQPRKK